MHLTKLSLCLLAMIITIITSVNASRHGEKIHFQASSELGELDIDQRSGSNRRRNHRGRALGHQKHNHVPQFEQDLPGIYPIRGPPQAPLVLPSHPGRGVGLQNRRPQTQPLFPPVQTPNNLPPTLTHETPIFSTGPKENHQPVQQPLNYQYAGNTFLTKTEIDSNTPATDKNNPLVYPGVTNQLPTSDKPATTTPSRLNPREYDLLYGSNLLDEDAKREGKAEEETEISFIDRGLFDTAPHCKPGQILVNTKCRSMV